MRTEDTNLAIKLIREGKLEEALSLIIESCGENSQKTQEAILLSSQLNEINECERLGTKSSQEISQVKNHIRKSILDLLSDKKSPKQLTRKDKKGTIELIFTIILGVSFFVFFVFFISQVTTSCEEYGKFISELRELQKQKEKNIQEQKEKEINEKGQIQHAENYDYLIFDAEDNAGNKAEYILYIVNGFNWKLGKVAVSEEYGIEFDICLHLTEIGISERINSDSLKSIICFGNTSYEEDLSIPYNQRTFKEEQRAQRRADKLASCVNRVLKNLTPVYTLNLGKYNLQSEFSEWQRQILIIGLLKKEDDTIEQEALYNGLVKEHYRGNLEFNIIFYSKVDNSLKSLEMKKRYN